MSAQGRPRPRFTDRDGRSLIVGDPVRCTLNGTHATVTRLNQCRAIKAFTLRSESGRVVHYEGEYLVRLPNPTPRPVDPPWCTMPSYFDLI